MDQSENAETQNWKTLALHSGGFPTLHHRRHFHKAFSGVFLTLLAIGFTSNVFAQGGTSTLRSLKPEAQKVVIGGSRQNLLFRLRTIGPNRPAGKATAPSSQISPGLGRK